MNGLTRISPKNGVAENFSQQTPEKILKKASTKNVAQLISLCHLQWQLVDLRQ